MDVKATYEEGHLLVAAVRILKHRHQGRPPTVEEAAVTAGLSKEWAGVLAGALEREGILVALKGPFETRLDVGDHLALEKLPRGQAGPGVDEELKEFSARKRREEETLRNLFATGDALRKQEKKLDRLADDLKKFKSKKPGSSSLFGDPPEED